MMKMPRKLVSVVVGKSFTELAPVLTLRGAYYKLKGMIYDSGVRSAIVYSRETGPIKK